jgi:hypothetical protein
VLTVLIHHKIGFLDINGKSANIALFVQDFLHDHFLSVLLNQERAAVEVHITVLLAHQALIVVHQGQSLLLDDRLDAGIEGLHQQLKILLVVILVCEVLHVNLHLLKLIP